VKRLEVNKTLVEKSTPNTRVAADFLLEKIRQTSKGRNVDDHMLLPAYTASVCASIEFRINQAYIGHFYQKLGDSYEVYAAPYVRMGIEQKMSMLFPLISDFKYELNRKNDKVKELFKLFRLRNRLIHQTPHLIEATFHKVRDSVWFIEYPDDVYKYAHAHPEWQSINRKDLVMIHASLNFWMPWLYDIEKRITRKKYNHKDILVCVK
jgi:hypothetical protein